jgi:pimeloyl-[acyl-carrier protein] methyl ester esterase
VPARSQPLPAIVLLPGMDGTGALLVDLAAALGTEFDVIVVSYPVDRALDYAALERIARSRLPSNGPHVLVAESFSGPIAISIAAAHCPGVRSRSRLSLYPRC